MALFGRRVILQIGTEGDEGRSFEDLRIRFHIAMTDSSTPNKGKFEVYNIAPETAALARAEGCVIRLLAGYDPDVPRLLFHGNPIDGGVTLQRMGPDRLLKLEAQDGGRAWRESALDVTYDAETSAEVIFAAAAEAMGLPLGTVDLGDGGVSLASGVSLSGPARTILDRVAAMTGAQWVIRDGTLVVWQQGSTTGESAVVFSVEAGNLIGAPTVKDGGVEVTGLLAPTMRPGKPFRVVSEYVSGDYTSEDVTFRGDSGFATDFYCVVTGKPR